MKKRPNKGKKGATIERKRTEYVNAWCLLSRVFCSKPFSVEHADGVCYCYIFRHRRPIRNSGSKIQRGLKSVYIIVSLELI